MHRSLLACAGILLLASATLSCHQRHHQNQPSGTSSTTAPQPTTTPQTPNVTGRNNTGTIVGSISNLVEDSEDDQNAIFRRKRDDGNHYKANIEKHNVNKVDAKAALFVTNRDHQHKPEEGNKFAAGTGNNMGGEKGSGYGVKKSSNKSIAGDAGVGTSGKHDKDAKMDASYDGLSAHESLHKDAGAGDVIGHFAVENHGGDGSAVKNTTWKNNLGIKHKPKWEAGAYGAGGFVGGDKKDGNTRNGLVVGSDKENTLGNSSKNLSAGLYGNITVVGKRSGSHDEKGRGSVTGSSVQHGDRAPGGTLAIKFHKTEKKDTVTYNDNKTHQKVDINKANDHRNVNAEYAINGKVKHHNKVESSNGGKAEGGLAKPPIEKSVTASTSAHYNIGE